MSKASQISGSGPDKIKRFNDARKVDSHIRSTIHMEPGSTGAADLLAALEIATTALASAEVAAKRLHEAPVDVAIWRDVDVGALLKRRQRSDGSCPVVTATDHVAARAKGDPDAGATVTIYCAGCTGLQKLA